MKQPDLVVVSDGEKISDKRCGKPKTDKDVTAVERESMEHQQSNFDRNRQKRSEAVLGTITEAARHVSGK